TPSPPVPRRNSMRKWIAVFILSLAVALPAFSTDKTDVAAVVRQFVDGFNKGDVKSALATCAEQGTIIDEFPPYTWSGAEFCSRWASAYDADAKKNGMTDAVVTMGSARHVDIDGDHAYVVAPVSFAYKQNGKAMNEAGSTM